MASIGKVAIAAASVAQETTLALSNINFDFSLVKLEAPLEYRRLGAVLSNKRKREAEDGSSHITARKLGALFISDLPPIPNLTRAYGLRTSEIVENPKFNPRSSPSHGPFADYVGADGTSIWAAATSGSGAMAVHLLACMLARIWSGPEATSIWTELVATRKAVLQSRLQEQEFPLSMVTASAIEIERHQLAEWDGSARSWIRTADSAKKYQQTQLMLIVDNMDIPITRKATVYNDVMSVWTQALSIVENLVSGVAQSVNTGESLLGLIAWHIYPDICAIGDKATTVAQNDHLVAKGGVVTLGLQQHRNRDPSGISWSMPLAHLRYYGGAVPSQRTVGLRNTKVNFDQIVLVALGSTMTKWNNHDRNLDRAMQFFIAFSSVLQFCHEDIEELSWSKMLADQAHRYLSSGPAERKEMARLIGLGWRRCSHFLAPEKNHPPPLFGLTDPKECIRFLPLPDQAIATVRNMVNHTPINLNMAVTRHVNPTLRGFAMIEYALIGPLEVQGPTCRWITIPHSWWDEEGISMVLNRATYIKETLGELCGLIEPGELFEEIRGIDADTHRRDLPPRLIAKGSYKRLGFWQHLEQQCVENKSHKNCIEWLKSDHDQYLDFYEGSMTINHESYLGENDSGILLYVVRQLGLQDSKVELPVEFVTQALRAQGAELSSAPSVSVSVSIRHREGYFQNQGGISPYYESLTALAAAREVFKTLPNAEVDLSIVERSLIRAYWAQELWPKEDCIMDRASAMACICMFESGELNLDPGDLEDVLAVSSSNNLYATEILFCDPSKSPPEHALRHIVGNIGRPGLALLLSPKRTVVREPSLDNWELVNHAPFDGRFEDNFQSTSLHISLTGYEQPVNIHDHGDRDSVVHFVEAVVSAHDHGVWHADLDLLHLSNDPWPRLAQVTCAHTEEQKADISQIADFISLDNWYEALDYPQNPAIIRSQNNWVARLALAGVPYPEHQQLVVTSDRPCCTCINLHRRLWINKSVNLIYLC